MTLAAGSKLGPYESLAPIGAGGMGEVYRARDTKLKRDVALKVLPEPFAHDRERMARFQREAEVLASLNHPNIAAVYGLEDRALVMELVEGESPKGPMPFEEAWKVASQIADALEYAHDKGVVHRDLKPANVKVTPEGVVKLLDFGLAKAFNDPVAGASAGDDPSNSPTITLGATVPGTILGTAAYMAPEQAKGQRIDSRADIWSWGVVLYELLTGKRLFRGKDAADTLAQVLTRQPDLEGVPAHTRRMLQECLQKEPKSRLRHIGDAKRLLDAGWVGGPPIPQRMALHHWVAWAASGVLAIALVALGFVHFRPAPPSGQPMHLSVALPEDASVRALALSPDGRNLAIAAVVGSQYHLWLRGINSTELRPLPATDLARLPFWSPDGRFIGFFADGKLKTIPATGGPPTVLCDAPSLFSGGTWNRDGVILFGSQSRIYRVVQTGGACAPVTSAETGVVQEFPEFLPDGRRFFYVQAGAASALGVYVASLDDPKGRRVLADVSSVAYMPPSAGNKLGYLLFLRENTLMALPFEDAALQPAGDVAAIAGQASFSNTQPQMAASLAVNGVLAYLTNGETSSARKQLTWVDRQGKEIEKVGTASVIDGLSLSPDEKTVAYARSTNGSAFSALWMHDLIRGSDSRVTPAEQSFGAVWSPQANRIIFGGVRQGNAFTDLYLKDIGGSQEELLFRNGNDKTPSDWSRDGRYLVYTEIDPRTHADIWYLQDPLSKERKAIRFQGTPFNESQGQISHDGHLIAYTSDESGQYEVYVRPFPTGDGKWTVSSKGGNEPHWSRDGKELFYLEGLTPRQRMMAVAVTPGARQTFGSPQRLFDYRINGWVPAFNRFLYSPSADGRRFLATEFAADVRPTLDVLFNWQKAIGGEGK